MVVGAKAGRGGAVTGTQTLFFRGEKTKKTILRAKKSIQKMPRYAASSAQVDEAADAALIVCFRSPTRPPPVTELTGINNPGARTA